MKLRQEENKFVFSLYHFICGKVFCENTQTLYNYWYRNHVNKPPKNPVKTKREFLLFLLEKQLCALRKKLFTHVRCLNPFSFVIIYIVISCGCKYHKEILREILRTQHKHLQFHGINAILKPCYGLLVSDVYLALNLYNFCGFTTDDL